MSMPFNGFPGRRGGRGDGWPGPQMREAMEHAFGQFEIGQPTLSLQQFEDAPIGTIEHRTWRSWHSRSLRRNNAQLYCCKSNTEAINGNNLAPGSS